MGLAIILSRYILVHIFVYSTIHPSMYLYVRNNNKIPKSIKTTHLPVVCMVQITDVGMNDWLTNKLSHWLGCLMNILISVLFEHDHNSTIKESSRGWPLEIPLVIRMQWIHMSLKMFVIFFCSFWFGNCYLSLFKFKLRTFF